jgi:hypothetical protein
MIEKHCLGESLNLKELDIYAINILWEEEEAKMVAWLIDGERAWRKPIGFSISLKN